MTERASGQIQAGRGAAGCALLAAVVTATACKKHPAPSKLPPRRARPELRFDASAKHHLEASVSAAVRKTIAEVRERRLALSPARVPPGRLAFTPRRFAQLGDRSLTVWNLASNKKLLTLPVGGPRQVITLADGSLLVAGAASLERLAPAHKKPETSPYVTLFSRSRLIADRADPFAFFTLHAFGSTLYKYRLPGHAPHSQQGDAGAAAAAAALLGTTSLGGLLPMSEYYALDGADHRGFAELRDGSFLYTTTHGGFSHFFAGAKHAHLGAVPQGRVWRLLAAARVNEFWAALDSGTIDRVRIAQAPRVVQQIKTGSMVYDVAANQHWLATVQVSHPDGGVRSWKLVVYDYSGKVALGAALPPAAPPPPGENWVQAVTKNRGVTVSSYAPWVAVGGPTWFSVWNIKKKRRVFGSKPGDAGK